jgi:hypothetical protein
LNFASLGASLSYADFAQSLIQEARRLYAGESLGLELEQTVYALDASTIDLCLALFPWARFPRSKGAIKLHTLLDLNGNIPTFLRITAANVTMCGSSTNCSRKPVRST